MAVYLIDHPPRIRQYRSPRRATPSGVCVVHTAESFPDESGPDTGAENVAAFIRGRGNYGSYHDLADSDSIVQLVDYDDEAFHDGTGSNPHSYGVSAATQAHRWPTLSDGWVDATVRNMARASARYARWIKTEHGVTIPARRITRAQSERRVPGFISHAQRDPARRTDPGATFPWDDFLGYYAAEIGDDDMPAPKDWDNDDIEALRRILYGDDKYLRYSMISEDYNLGFHLRDTRAWAIKNGERLARVLANQQAIMAAQGVEVDETELGQQIAAVLVPAVVAEVSDATDDETEAVMERVLRRVLGSLDDA